MKARRNVWLVLVCILVGLFITLVRPARKVNAQENASVPYQGQNTGAYQMFFSPHVRADTFLVDTAKGVVWVLASDKDGNSVLQKVVIEPAPAPSASQAGHYKIYFSAMVRKDTFLVDTITGKTWLMVQDKDKNTIFQAITVEGL